LLPLSGALSAVAGEANTWREQLQQRLPAYGHRNWICIVDAAYPAQTSPGVETLVTGADQLTVVREVLAALAKAPHVKPVAVVDAELPAVAEADAPGIGVYRTDLERLLTGTGVERTPHEAIIRDLDRAGSLVHVLVLKTNLTLPYTSVFLRLECGYWSPEAETRLRSAIAKPLSR
jgi:L-fucose mutarotase/ribose pyranase (RbsD/FucU family)